MSIITDALNKAQSRRNKNEGPEKNAGAPSDLHTPRLSKMPVLENKQAYGRLLPFFIFMLLLVFISGALFFALRKNEPDIKSPAGTSSVAAASDPKSRSLPLSIPRFSRTSFPQRLPELTGIMYSAGNPQAVLNGQMLGEGSKIGKYTLKRIYADRVILETEGAEYELKLK